MDVMKSGNWTLCHAILVWNHTYDFKSNEHCVLDSVQLPLLTECSYRNVQTGKYYEGTGEYCKSH